MNQSAIGNASQRSAAVSNKQRAGAVDQDVPGPRSTSDTRLSRIDGPVCITRLAIRPANRSGRTSTTGARRANGPASARGCRTLAAIAWLAMMFCMVSAGRAQAPGAPPPSSVAAARRSRTGLSGRPAVIKVMMRPMNTGISESSSASAKPAANRPANRPLACRA